MQEIAWIYDAMSARGIYARDVDEMEMWMIARALGLDRAADRQMTEGERRAEDARLNAARVRAAAGDGPPVDFEPTGPILSDSQVQTTLKHLRAARAARAAEAVK